jgi:hypothetical protein
MAVYIYILGLIVMKPCSLVSYYEYFESTFCLFISEYEMCLRILFYLMMEAFYCCEAQISNVYIFVHSSIEIPSLPIISENCLFSNLKIKINQIMCKDQVRTAQ